MAKASQRAKPTFTVQPNKAGPGYVIIMDPNAYEPILHIGDFNTKEEADAWIKLEATAWLEKRTSSSHHGRP